MIGKRIAVLSKGFKDYLTYISNHDKGITYVLVREPADLYGNDFSGYEETEEAKLNPHYNNLKGMITKKVLE